MAESLVQVTEGAGKKLHTFSRTIGANVVEDEVVVPGEPYLASYVIAPASIAVATANDHLLQIMAGASLLVRIRRIRIQLFTPPAAAGTLGINLLRLTTAGTGGTVVTPQKQDNNDAAAGMTAMTLPTVKGTEGANALRKFGVGMPAAQPVTTQYADEWIQLVNQKPITIPVGITNGICLKLVAGNVATATIVVNVDVDESTF